jgi:hypothetical protein
MILEMILHDTLHKEMGWNWEKDEGYVSLGMRAKKEELVFPPYD